MQWMSSPAERYLLGPRRTGNPSIAAASLLGKRRVSRAKRKLRGRRSFHRGNPVPALIAAAGPLLGKVKLLRGLVGRFKQSSRPANEAAVNALLPLALQGLLAAVQAIISRSTITNENQGAPWRIALTQLPPNLKAAAGRAVAAGKIPASWWNLTPEQVMSTVATFGDVAETEEEAARTAAAERKEAARGAAAAGERRETRLTAAGAAIGQALLGRGRGLRRPTRRRRRPQARAFSF